MTPLAKDLVIKMLTVNIKERYSADQVLNHPWMKLSTEEITSLDTQPSKKFPMHSIPEHSGQSPLNSIVSTSNTHNNAHNNSIPITNHPNDSIQQQQHHQHQQENHSEGIFHSTG